MMKKIDPFKKVWGDYEWPIYLKNLKMLCKKHGILQKDFNQLVGVVAAFRRDINRPSNDIIKTICDYFKVSTDWILEYHDDFELDTVKQPELAYDPHGGYKPDPEKALGVERGTQQWKAFELLSKIYASADQELIGAIFSNLKSFADAAKQKSENAELKRKVDGLELKIDELMKQLNQNGIIRLRDRRSGADRRCVLGASPTGEERRLGGDRRKTFANNNSTN